MRRLEVEGAHRVDTPLPIEGLSEPQVQAALRRLEAGGYIVGVATEMPYPIIITSVTERGREPSGLLRKLDPCCLFARPNLR